MSTFRLILACLFVLAVSVALSLAGYGFIPFHAQVVGLSIVKGGWWIPILIVFQLICAFVAWLTLQGIIAVTRSIRGPVRRQPRGGNP